jgi:hypothetical protein
MNTTFPSPPTLAVVLTLLTDMTYQWVYNPGLFGDDQSGLFGDDQFLSQWFPDLFGGNQT